MVGDLNLFEKNFVGVNNENRNIIYVVLVVFFVLCSNDWFYVNFLNGW